MFKNLIFFQRYSYPFIGRQFRNHIHFEWTNGRFLWPDHHIQPQRKQSLQTHIILFLLYEDLIVIQLLIIYLSPYLPSFMTIRLR